MTTKPNFLFLVTPFYSNTLLKIIGNCAASCVNGECYLGSCVCYTQYSGDDCSISGDVTLDYNYPESYVFEFTDYDSGSFSAISSVPFKFILLKYPQQFSDEIFFDENTGNIYR
jgi:hypothetical protein